MPASREKRGEEKEERGEKEKREERRGGKKGKEREEERREEGGGRGEKERGGEEKEEKGRERERGREREEEEEREGKRKKGERRKKEERKRGKGRKEERERGREKEERKERGGRRKEERRRGKRKEGRREEGRERKREGGGGGGGGRRRGREGEGRGRGGGGFDGLGLGLDQGGGGGLELRLQGLETRGMIGARLELRGLRLDLGALGLEPRQPVGDVADRPLELGAPSDRPGQCGGRVGKGLFAVGERRLGAGNLLGRLLAGLARALDSLAQVLLLVGEPGQHTVGIGAKRLFAGDIAVELGDAPLELGHALARPPLLAVELVACQHQALQGRGRLGGLVAQGRQLMGRDRLHLRGFGLAGGALGHEPRLGLDQARGLAHRFARLAELQENQRRLGLADIRRQAAVADRLARLALQAVELALDLGDHHFQPLEIGLGRLQTRLGLVPPGIEAGNAGRLFQNAAARLGLGVDDLADLALADQRRRARAGGGIGEQDLHVTGAHLAAVDLVDRTRLALDAARDFQRVVVVELGRRQALAVVDGERHLGGVARRPVARTRKDHVVHAGRAHVLERILAHHPAQRLDEIRLAAAVRPDHAGQARLDQEFHRLDEGLEAENAQARELHGSQDSLRSLRWIGFGWASNLPRFIGARHI
ncbi:hypothetical protein BN1110_06406 [bacterium YEK0313]|nr:hypothetical protein BN1110_06406 [bacterium YEK0313]